MNTHALQSRQKRLYRYAIACSDIYYTELEQRDVFACNDPSRGFRIWGEIASIGPASSVGLCQMFLEYAMYCRSWGTPAEAMYNIKDFGEQLGIALANFLKENPPADMHQNPGACALICLLESLNVQLTVEQAGPELHFIFAECPLEEVARRTGLRDVDLALYGVNSMVQSLVHHIDEHILVQTPSEASASPVFSIMETA